MMKKLISALIVIGYIFLTGCTVVEEPINLSSMPPSKQAEPNSPTTSKTQQEDSIAKSINAALVWSEKYEKLMTQMEELKKFNENLTIENENLNNQLTAKDKELVQTQKELKEANEILVSMRVELSSWKKDVLGFREEMRQSQQALLAASAKILRELGAEIREIPTQEKPQVAKGEQTK